ncbi:hypothetical protein H2O64_20795 [Kordia sp. YSTF-M3]|uniref:Uncharacterized protein n=1 Tax=Kordia aestuariivivens TaxID=2759037 RepID=A0ABR7QEW8_9FLAO|nr:hypothetical protein [Kordia aestuariivivens]MBC8757124.1 hypothetical protein [Kordia aestuariivivens]
MNQEIKNILSELNSDKTEFSLLGTTTLKTNFDISPQEFIKYAELDLSSNYEHNIVNALSNAKRALDSQLDSLLVCLGYYGISQKKYWSFPKKIDLINELGIIAPRVLRKINKQRNLLEHQFIKPDEESVEDFLDITLLFIASTDRFTLKFANIIHLKNIEQKKLYVIENNYVEEKLNVHIYKTEKQFSLAYLEPEKIENELISTNSYNHKDIDYDELLKFYLTYLK